MPNSATAYSVGSKRFSRQILQEAANATGKPHRSRAIQSTEPVGGQRAQKMSGGAWERNGGYGEITHEAGWATLTLGGSSLY